MADNSIKWIIFFIIILFVLVVIAIILSAIALANQGSSGSTGFKVVKVTSTGPTDITVTHPVYIQVSVPGTTGSATINLKGDNGSVALIRNSNSTVDVFLTSNKDMFILSSRESSNSYKLKTNTYALMIWDNGNTYIAPF